MQKVLEFKDSGNIFSLFTDGFAKTEVFADGVYEVLSLDDHVKIRLFSNTGVREKNTIIAENNLTLILPKGGVQNLLSLLGKLDEDKNNRGQNSTITALEQKEEDFETFSEA